MRSAQEGRRRHRERAGPRRRLLPAQPGDERLGAWEANPRTCRRMATPRPPHGRIREEETRGGKGRRGGSRKDARGQARPSVCPRAGTHLSPRLRAPPLAASPGSPSCRRGLPPPPSPPPAAPPPPQPGSQRLSPPLSLRSLLSPPCAPPLLFLDGAGGWGKAVPPPPAARLVLGGGWGTLRLTSSSGSPGPLRQSQAFVPIKLGFLVPPLSHPPPWLPPPFPMVPGGDPQLEPACGKGCERSATKDRASPRGSC